MLHPGKPSFKQAPKACKMPNLKKCWPWSHGTTADRVERRTGWQSWPHWPNWPNLNLKPSIKATDHHHDPRTPSWWHWPVLIMLMHDHRPRFCVCTPLHCTPVHDKTGHEWWQRKAVNIPIIGVGVMYFSHILSNVPLSRQKGKIE